MLLSCCSYSIPVSLPSPQKNAVLHNAFIVSRLLIHGIRGLMVVWIGLIIAMDGKHLWGSAGLIWSSLHGPVCCVSVCLCLLILLRASMVGSSAKKRFGSSALRNSYGQSRRDCCCASVAFLRPYMLTIFKVVCSAVYINQLPSKVSNSPKTTMKTFTLGWDPTTNTSIAKMWSSAFFSCGALLSVCHRCGFCLPRPNALALSSPSHRTLLSQVSPQKVFLDICLLSELQVCWSTEELYSLLVKRTNNCLVPTPIHERTATLQYSHLFLVGSEQVH